MNIKYEGITRGEGKAYQVITISPFEVGYSVSVRAWHDDVNLPCIIAPINKSKGVFLLIFSALAVAQSIEVSVASGSEPIFSAVKNYGHISTALGSKLNTFTNKEDVLAYRNYDARALPEQAKVAIKLAIPDFEHGQLVMYAKVEFSIPEAAVASTAFQIHLFDRNCRPIDFQGLTTLNCDQKIEDDGWGKTAIDFSFVVSADIEDYVCWITFEDERIPDGFVVSFDYDTNGLKAWTQNLIIGDSGEGPKYQEWFLSQHKTSQADLLLQRHKRFEIEPTFSIIVPLYKTPEHYFWDMYNSVAAQTYGRWELILVNASPEDCDLRRVVAEAAEKDSRIKVVQLSENKGITLNTNEGIAAAIGDFVSFFDHDDVLEPDLLFEYVKGINLYPDTDLLYCDEDKIDDDGNYFAGLLKPDFDHDLILACNYVCHLLTVRKSVIDSFELPGQQYDGSQDHNMTLKVSEQARNIYHARKVLYHWRVHPGSTAAGAQEKPWTLESGRLAVQEHLDRIGAKATVSNHPGMGNFYDINYKVEGNPKVSIVIPNKDCTDYLQNCLESIYAKTKAIDFEIIVVENNSDQPMTFQYYESIAGALPHCKVVYYEGDFNFSAICNFGARYAVGDYLLFLNNDTKVVVENWLELMLGALQQRTDVGVVGAKLLYPNDAIQHVGVILPRSEPKHSDDLLPCDSNGYFGFVKFPRNVSAVTGACMLVSKALFDSLDGFDEQLAVSYNDVDFCLRVREKGLLVVVEPRSVLYHFESVSRGYDRESQSKRIRLQSELAQLMSRHPSYFVNGDPYYSVNCVPGSTHHQLFWE